MRDYWVLGWINLCHKRLRLNVALATARSASEASKSPLPLFAKEGKFFSKLIVTGLFTFLISIEIKLSAFKKR